MNVNFFFSKKALKSLNFVIICDLQKHTRREYKGKIFVKNIRKNNVGSETNRKVGPGYGFGFEKIIPDPQH
jgi:hypothetical protein